MLRVLSTPELHPQAQVMNYTGTYCPTVQGNKLILLLLFDA